MLRSKLIRVAASFPKGSSERRALLALLKDAEVTSVPLGIGKREGEGEVELPEEWALALAAQYPHGFNPARAKRKMRMGKPWLRWEKRNNIELDLASKWMHKNHPRVKLVQQEFVAPRSMYGPVDDPLYAPLYAASAKKHP